MKRNARRKGKECIPKVGVLATYKKLELPSFDEGFDELFYVKIEGDGFNISKWKG